jgi:hypothetical protein
MNKWTLGQAGKTKPIQSQFKPNTKPIQTQYKAKTNPIQTQTNPIYSELACPERSRMGRTYFRGKKIFV